VRAAIRSHPSEFPRTTGRYAEDRAILPRHLVGPGDRPGIGRVPARGRGIRTSVRSGPAGRMPCPWGGPPGLERANGPEPTSEGTGSSGVRDRLKNAWSKLALSLCRVVPSENKCARGFEAAAQRGTPGPTVHLGRSGSTTALSRPGPPLVWWPWRLELAASLNTRGRGRPGRDRRTGESRTSSTQGNRASSGRAGNSHRDNRRRDGRGRGDAERVPGPQRSPEWCQGRWQGKGRRREILARLAWWRLRGIRCKIRFVSPTAQERRGPPAGGRNPLALPGAVSPLRHLILAQARAQGPST
jgi:hypothetical protein